MAFYRFEIDSPLDPASVLERLRPLTSAQRGTVQLIKQDWGFLPQDTSPFIGTVGSDGFSLRARINYRNSFLPQVRGVVRASSNGSRILVTMNLHPMVVVFMIFWLGFVGVGLLNALASYPAKMGDTAVLAGMFMFGVLLVAGGFYPEARKMRRLLENAIVGPAP